MVRKCNGITWEYTESRNCFCPDFLHYSASVLLPYICMGFRESMNLFISKCLHCTERVGVRNAKTHETRPTELHCSMYVIEDRDLHCGVLSAV
jgi:hypothetical protein